MKERTKITDKIIALIIVLFIIGLFWELSDEPKYDEAPYDCVVGQYTVDCE